MPAEDPQPLPSPRRPPIRDPHAIPVVAVDSHLPPVRRDRLDVAAVRRRLAEMDDWVPPITGDGARPELFGDRPIAPASVLVPLVQRQGELHVLLTRRTDHLHDHAGQVSFPGGRAEPGDADAIATALREAEEEVGLKHSSVEIIGRLPVYTTVTRFVVTPVVGLVQPDYTLALDAFEVAEAFEVPLHFLMNPANHRHHEFEFAGARRRFLSMPWRAGHGDPREYFIWGATAAMLRNLYHLLAE
jgi:8-oxo-dGTP pyrophosphatase MutT (NUDIX family)